MNFGRIKKNKIPKTARFYNFFATKKWYLMTFAVLLPAVFQQILSASMNLMDNIMVGQLHNHFIPEITPMNSRIKNVFELLGLWDNQSWWNQNGLTHFFHLQYSAGQVAFAGVTASNQIFVIIFAIMGGFINAVGIFGAQFYGAGRYGSLRQTVVIKLVFGFIIAMIVIILSYTVGYYLITYTTSPASAKEHFLMLCRQNNIDGDKLQTLINFLDYNNSQFSPTEFSNFYQQNFHGNEKNFTEIILKYYDYRSAELATANGIQYNQFIVFSYPFFAINYAFVSAFRETKRGYIPLLLTFAAVIMNFFLNLLLINGIENWGINGIGTRGSAIATLISRIVQLGLIGFFLVWKKYEFRPQIKKFFKVKKNLLKQILHTAWPLILNDFLFAIAATIMIRLISQWSFDALSGAGIAATINTMFYTLYIGFGIASSVLIASRLGSDDLVNAKSNAKHLIRLGFFVSLFFSGLLVLTSFIVPPLLMDATGEAIRIAEWMVRVDALIFSTYTIMYVCIYAFRAGGLSKTVLFIDSIFTWTISVLLLFLLIYFSSFDIIVIYFIVRMAEVVKMIVSLIVYRRFKWVRNLASKKTFYTTDDPKKSEIDETNSKKQLPEIKIANF